MAARRACRAPRGRAAARPPRRAAVVAQRRGRAGRSRRSSRARRPRSCVSASRDGVGVALLQQTRGAGLDEDDVDRVRGRVVQVAGDPRPLLGRGEPALALRVALGARVRSTVGEPPPPLAHLVADDPRAAPDDDPEQDRRWSGSAWSRERASRRRGSRTCRARRPRSARMRASRALVGGDEEERDRRPERRPERVAEPVQRRARGGRQGEDAERRAAAGEQREAGERRERDAERVELPVRAVGAARAARAWPRTPTGDEQVA